MKRYKSGIFSAILPTVMLALALALGSCAKQEVPEGGEFGDGKATVTLELVPPGAFSEVQTRAMTDANQNAINRATVLVFKDDKVVQQVVATMVEGNKMTINDIKTSQSESDKYDIVVLGNPPTDISNYLGWSKDALPTSIKLNPKVTGKWAGTEFMMWGEATGILIHPVTNSFQIRMLRSLARIDIGLGTYNEATPDAPWSGLSNFTLSDVRVLNTSNKFAVIPDPVNVDPNGTVTAPSIPSDATTTITSIYSGADIVKGSYCQSTIFVPETNSPLSKPIKLIIKGKYNGGPDTYYRIDMCLPDNNNPGKYLGMDILRNHLYRISITKVLGPGYENYSADAPALNNIAIELNPIDEGGCGDIIFDAHSSITTDVADAVIYGLPNKVTPYMIVNVKAVFPQRMDVNVSGTEITDPKTLTSGTLTPIKVQPRATKTSGSVTITVGRLKKVINYTVQPPVDAHFDFLPFKEVADMTIEKPQSWITLSQNRTYVKNEQQNGRITGDANGKAVVHFDENIATTDDPRQASMLLQRTTNPMSKTRVIFEQLNLNGMVLGLFGGTKDDQGYTKQLAVESVEEYEKRVYDDNSFENPVKKGLQWGFRNIETKATEMETGQLSTITLAKEKFTDNGVVTNETDLNIYNNYAARYCYDKNRDTNGTPGLQADEIVWYMPSQNQLMGAWIAKTGVQTPFTDYYYWSVTEKSNNTSLSAYFYHGITRYSDKTEISRVRCVREISQRLP